MKNLEKPGIYIILNVINNKCYIGSSRNMYKRKRQHFKDLKANKHYNQHLQRAWNKYGENSFVFTALEENFEIENLWEREIHWIIQKNSLDGNFGYNLGIPKKSDNCNLRKETIDKLILATYNQYYKDNPKMSLEEFMQGKRAKDLIEKLGKLNKKKVFCFNSKTGVKEFEFESITDCVKYFNTSDNYLRRLVDANNRTFKNLILVTEENYNPDKIYIKTYKPKRTTKPKGRFEGNTVETYNLETLETINTYSNLNTAAEQLNTSKKYLQKVLYKEKKSFKGMGVRLNKSLT